MISSSSRFIILKGGGCDVDFNGRKNRVNRDLNQRRQACITHTFIWSYKRGDNIIYNFEILDALYRVKKHEKNNLYNKPIIIIIVAIIECILHDFVERIQQRAKDPLPNITEEIVEDIKYKGKGETRVLKELKKMSHYLAKIEKHKLLGDDVRIYGDLDELKKQRDRVHIQASYRDEEQYFTGDNLKLAEQALEHVLRAMFEKYPRNQDAKQILADFPYPWDI